MFGSHSCKTHDGVRSRPRNGFRLRTLAWSNAARGISEQDQKELTAHESGAICWCHFYNFECGNRFSYVASLLLADDASNDLIKSSDMSAMELWVAMWSNPSATA